MKPKATLPYIDYNKCIHCEKCILICPTQVIEKIPNSNCDKCIKYCIVLEVTCFPYNYLFNYDHCNSCGLCVAICPEGAVKWSSDNEDGTGEI